MSKPVAPVAAEWTRPEPQDGQTPPARLPWPFQPDAALPAVPAVLDPEECPPDAADRIRATAGRGGSLKALHALFGVTADVFKRWMDDDPGLRRAFDEGKEHERETLHRVMYEAAIFKRDLSAAQFLLKTRHGYREQEPEDSRNSVRIIFNLPAAAPDMKTYVEQAQIQGLPDKPRRTAVIDHE